MISDGQPPRLCLWGMPGVGKSTIGAVLASRLNLDFFDLDKEIENAQGLPIGELIKSRGIDAFRAREEEAVLAFAQHGQGVMALGGGAVLSAPPRDQVGARRGRGDDTAAADGQVLWVGSQRLHVLRRRGGGCHPTHLPRARRVALAVRAPWGE